MKTQRVHYFCLCLFLGLLSQCKAPVPGPDLTRNWKASEVKEGTVIVYREGSLSNIYPGYSQFQMAFQQNSVTYTEFTGDTFTGTWELTNNNQNLTFRGLTPEPYGTEGLIEFTLLKWSTNQLVIRRNTLNPKTGDQVNEYTLIPK
ncbi:MULTISPECIES: hypothetical protein [unclassified Spirosoma]|uniref:hypothetical protein n=1 Tax=unclassified Spirosoma TaxID=2621999 RepID=UPI000A4C1584|nr:MULTISPECIES: hypothetical protein [unclassified Spirosoma]MBN8823768.1 hypothetical protein [Spirosoma sp.]